MSNGVMKAVAVKQDAPLFLEELPIPSPGPGQVRIKVEAAGINRPDVYQRAGLYPPPPGAPDTMGLEAAGRIDALGEGVDAFSVGEAVTALLPGGGYAQYALAHAGSTLSVPKGLSMAEAAALPETVFTVWSNVFMRCNLKPGEDFLVHGGASGIGTTAIQIAKAYGATVYATAGTEDKCALCESLGATRAINYKTEAFEDVLNEAGGVDVILDMAVGDYFQKNLSILKDEGRLGIIAFLKGPKVEANLMRLMLKRLTVTGSTLRPRSDADKADIAAEVRAHVWPMIEAGAFKPVIDSTFALEDVEEAHARMTGGDHAGKIVLTL
ncbi:MAG: NAD(P)H-quinone oxidoreductase [Pseudomonadota bacterium]